jgi:hypothetical protein
MIMIIIINEIDLNQYDKMSQVVHTKENLISVKPRHPLRGQRLHLSKEIIRRSPDAG